MRLHIWKKRTAFQFVDKPACKLCVILGLDPRIQGYTTCTS